MTRMFQRIRPRQKQQQQGSYFYLSEHANQSQHQVGQVLVDTTSKEALSNSTTGHNKNEKMTMMMEKEQEKLVTSLDTALAIQTTYTSWTHQIWEPNFDDADGEIVFEFSDGLLVEEEDHLNNISTTVQLKKSASDSTSITEDETNPSSCSSPHRDANNFLSTTTSPLYHCIKNNPLPSIECDALEFCERIGNDFSPIKVTPNHNNSSTINNDSSSSSPCALLACSADLRSQFLTGSNNTKSPRYNKQDTVNNTSNDNNILLIEESLEDLSPSSKDASSSLCSLNLGHHNNNNNNKNKTRAIRFADEEGQAMETVHLVESKEDELSLQHGYQRILVLLLLPVEKKFEFLHAEYNLDARVSVSVLLQQLPDMATDPMIAQQQYSRLCRAAAGSNTSASGGAELINALALQDYGLEQDEILIAVVNGYTGREMNRMARTLVENPQILRAVKRRNRYEHKLHTIKNNQEFQRDQARKEREAVYIEEQIRRMQVNTLEFDKPSRSSKRKQKAKHHKLGIEEIEIPLMHCHHRQSSDLRDEPSQTRLKNEVSKKSSSHSHNDSRREQSAPESSAPTMPDDDREDEDSLRPIRQVKDDEQAGYCDTDEEQRTPNTTKPKKSNSLRFAKRNSSSKRSTAGDNKSTRASTETPTNKLGKFAKRRWEQLRSIRARRKAAADKHRM